MTFRKSGSEELGRHGRGCSGGHGGTSTLESLSELEKVAIAFGTALAVVAAVAMLVIGAVVDLPWM